MQNVILYIFTAKGCMCKPGDYLCKNGKKCISHEKVCNGHYDCDDYDDEMNCRE